MRYLPAYLNFEFPPQPVWWSKAQRAGRLPGGGNFFIPPDSYRVECTPMLHGKKILIIGGGAGLGLAVARLALTEGARVVVASRSAPEKAGALSEFKGQQLEAYPFDLTQADGHQGLLHRVGEIDHLVIAVRPKLSHVPFKDIDLVEARQGFEVKFWQPLAFIQAAQKQISPAGSITLTSGIAGEKIYPGSTVMAAVDSAVETLCRALAVELAPLRVNTVSPGFVDPKPGEVRDYARRFPLGRLADPMEVARAYLGLMANTYQTGCIVVVDGGARLI